MLLKRTDTLESTNKYVQQLPTLTCYATLDFNDAYQKTINFNKINNTTMVNITILIEINNNNTANITNL